MFSVINSWLWRSWGLIQGWRSNIRSVLHVILAAGSDRGINSFEMDSSTILSLGKIKLKTQEKLVFERRHFLA